MAALLIGYARVSTDQQDLTAQRDGLQGLGVDPARIYVDHGLTGTNRERPGLREALDACRDGDTLVVTKLDRLARSLPDARAIAEELTIRRVRLSLGGSVYAPTDPVGRLLFNVLAMVAEFESDLIRMRTREGMKIAKAKGHLRGKQPKLKPRQEAHLVALLDGGEYTTGELAELFGVGRSTVYRALTRSRTRASSTSRPRSRSPRPANPSECSRWDCSATDTHAGQSQPATINALITAPGAVRLSGRVGPPLASRAADCPDEEREREADPSMKATPRERDTVVAYFEAQLDDDPVVHLEKVAVERVGSILHDIWDVHCRGSRWWAVSNPLNLYSQEDFKSRDVVLT